MVIEAFDSTSLAGKPTYDALQALCVAIDDSVAALHEHEIAAWYDGPVVGTHFDEPGSAQTAREALAKLGITGPKT